MLKSLTMIAALVALSLPGVAMAQRQPGWNDAGWKISGNSSRGHSGSYYSGRSQQSYARHQGEILYSYGKANASVPKQIVQQHTDAIKASSQAAIKDFDKLKAAAAEHPSVVKQIEAIQDHHKQVLALCDMLAAEAKNAEGDSVKICECCVNIVKELDAAEKKAEALKEPLKIDPPLSPLKAETGKK